jgi:hypothetical protein
VGGVNAIASANILVPAKISPVGSWADMLR